MIPAQMRFIEARGTGGPEVLALATGPVPQPGAGEILIKVHAAGVNRGDLAQRLGRYAPPPGASPVLGLEVAGTVAALGPGVEGWAPDSFVCALLAGGGYAEFCTAPAPQCLPTPQGVSLTEAAAIPEACATVWSNVFERGRLQSGESLLVHGGASGIGVTAIGLARAMGARVFATAGRDEKCDACLKLGAEAAINYRTRDFVAAMHRVTEGRGVDMVLDMIGGDYVAKNLEVLAPGGRLVQIAFLEGSEVRLDLRPMVAKGLTLSGSTLRPRTVAEKGTIAAALKEQVWPLIEAGKVKPLVARTFPLADAAGAHRLMEARDHIGKIVLTVAG
jgi:NADPH:quinone reductase